MLVSTIKFKQINFIFLLDKCVFLPSPHTVLSAFWYDTFDLIEGIGDADTKVKLAFDIIFTFSKGLGSQLTSNTRFTQFLFSAKLESCYRWKLISCYLQIAYFVFIFIFYHPFIDIYFKIIYLKRWFAITHKVNYNI